MSKLRIFIEGRELDTLDNVTVPITKQYEELSNPTIICNDYSKTVTVPLSKNNNDIFGHCYNPDRLISTSGDEDTPIVGLYFDPYKKLDCRLQWGDDVFFTGYAKMLKVTNKGYEVTINGELGKIFQELKKISFQKSDFESDEEIEKYWIDGAPYVNTTINRDLVYNCWNSEQDDYELRKTTDSNYDITDIIGFLANNSYSDDFDYSSIEMVDEETTTITKSFEDILEEEKFGSDADQTFQEATGISAESIVGDGLYPEQLLEWRSYEQIPFIYWNKFWKIFQAKAEELTGYSWDYSEWATDQNKSFNELGITLLQRDTLLKSSEDITDSSFTLTVPTTSLQYSSGSTNTFALTASGTTLVKDNKIQVNDGSALLNMTPTITIRVKNPTNMESNNVGFGDSVNTNGVWAGAIRLRAYYGSTTLFDYIFCSSVESSMNVFKNHYPESSIYGFDSQSVSTDAYSYINITFSTSQSKYILLTSDMGNREIEYKVEPIFHIFSGEPTLSCPIVFQFKGYGYSFAGDSVGTTKSSNIESDVTWRKTFFRSGDKITLNDICNLNFDNILDYCKRFRLYIYIDNLNKKLVFTRKYFNNYTITDKTDAIDKSTAFDVEPVTFDTHYILFGYAEEDTKLCKEYDAKYSIPYGGKRIITSYNFNTETNTLFDKSLESIVYTPSLLYWNKINQQYPTVLFFAYNNIFLEVRDSDGKTIDCSGAYFFPVKAKIDNSYATYISDDTELMVKTNIFTYNGLSKYKKLTTNWTTPELVLKDSLVFPTTYFTCLFEKPKKNYTTQADYFSKINETLYSSFWEKYMNERYNIQNKKVTTYVRLSPSDYINFKFNQFWKIGDQIYIVNKIFDYDITSTKPTKVELITVQNIDAYKS